MTVDKSVDNVWEMCGSCLETRTYNYYARTRACGDVVKALTAYY